MSQPVPAALNVSRVSLRILRLLNWIYGALLLAGLIVTFTAAQFVMRAIGGAALAPDTEPLLRAMRGVLTLGLATIPLHFLMLTRLLQIVESVRAGDPFVAGNAIRIQAIAWTLLCLQVIALAVGAVVKSVSTDARPFRVHAGFSTGAWLAIVLLFVLARVFTEGARMRDDLAATV